MISLRFLLTVQLAVVVLIGSFATDILDAQRSQAADGQSALQARAVCVVKLLRSENALHDHFLNTREANAKLSAWFDKKSDGINSWLKMRGKDGGPPDFWDFQTNFAAMPVTLTSEEALRAKNTNDLLNTYLDRSNPNSYIGGFYEGANVNINTPDLKYAYRSTHLAGLDVPKRNAATESPFESVVKQSSEAGVRTQRIGPNLADIDPNRPETWDPFLEKLEVMWKNNVTPIVSIAFFPNMERWAHYKNGEINHDRSYLLNEHWPADMEKNAANFMNRMNLKRKKFRAENPGLHEPRVILNPVNEPETLSGFGQQFWYDKKTPWGHPEYIRSYIRSIVNVARADVRMRIGAEGAAKGERLLFMHNEAMTPDYYPSHQGTGRFAQSKFMLGSPEVTDTEFNDYAHEPLVLMKTRLDALAQAGKLNEVDWAYREYVFGSWNKTSADQEIARAHLTSQFKNLQADHRELKNLTGKTMKTDNYLAVDYYYQTEAFLNHTNIPELIEKLTVNHGEKLKEALGLDPKDPTLDVKFFQMISDAIPFDAAHAQRDQIDFSELLQRDDHALLAKLLGLRRNNPPGGPADYQLGFEPQYYARQMRAGIRIGAYTFLNEYVKNLGIHVVGFGESGTPFYTFAPMLHDQVMMSLAAAGKNNGVYISNYSFQMTDTRGWVKSPVAMGISKDDEVSPSGAYMLKKIPGKNGNPNFAFEPRPWLGGFVDGFVNDMNHSLDK